METGRRHDWEVTIRMGKGSALKSRTSASRQVATWLPPEANLGTSDLLSSVRGSYVYFLRQGDECVYVGQTSSLRLRLSVHAQTFEFDKNWSKFAISRRMPQDERRARHQDGKANGHPNPPSGS